MVRWYQVRNGKELAETVQQIGFRKSVWQDIWHCRCRTAIVFFAAVTVLLWSAPTGRTYELLTILLLVASTVFPFIYLMRAIPNTQLVDRDKKLLDAGLPLINHADGTGVICFAILTLALVSANAALTYVPALRVTLEAPLPFAPGRWIAAILTSIAMTMLCHLFFFCAHHCWGRTRDEAGS
jgi:hypothetical protein